MYSRQESASIKRKFWTVFGQYMKPIRSSSEETVNWVNYNTGIKNIYFRLDATRDFATVSIEITHQDPGLRQAYFKKFVQFKQLFIQVAGNKWIWDQHYTDEHGKQISRIVLRLGDRNIFNENDWPAIISFFKPALISLDEFWTTVKEQML